MLADGELETAAHMAAALRRGEVSSAELVERALVRAETWEPPTNAFAQLWPQEAMAWAGEIDGGRREGLSRLAGIPIAVKDLFDVRGRETTGCSAAYAGNAARRDGAIIAAVRAAGLVILGKTNQHELAAGGTNVVSACGRTGNPWDPGRMTGGSSGGSAAAVASGVVPWSLGSDTGGSIRIPSSFCGTVGLKPTTGSLSIEGMLPLAPSLDCPGPIAATVADVWSLYGVLARGAGTETPPDAMPHPPRAGFRLGLLGGFFNEKVHPEVLAATQDVATRLEAIGVRVEQVDGRGIEDARRVWNKIAWSKLAAGHAALGDRRRLLHPRTAALFEYGERLSADEVAQARRRRDEIRRWFLGRLQDLDALVIPTTPYPAPRWDQDEVDLGPGGMVSVEKVGPGWLTCSVNLAGVPALTVPAAWSSDGLPIGVSFVGRDGDEEVLAGLAASWESAASGAPGRPPLPSRPERFPIPHLSPKTRPAVV